MQGIDLFLRRHGRDGSICIEPTGTYVQRRAHQVASSGIEVFEIEHMAYLVHDHGQKVHISMGGA
jgi:hypothetical protein